MLWTDVASALLEVGLVFFGKVRLVLRQLIAYIDRIVLAEGGAATAVDALIGIDEDLGDGSGGRIVRCGRDGRGGTLGYTNKILNTRIGDYIRHEKNNPSIWGDDFCSAQVETTDVAAQTL